MNNWHIRLAANAVNNGGIIAYPTEAVYGLGCSPWNIHAIASLLCLKRRSPAKGLIVVAANIGQLHALVDFDAVESLQVILDTWPGHVTWVLPAREGLPGCLTGKNSDIAVRVSAHPQVSKLCELCGPLVSTSANIANNRAALTTMAVRNYFQDSLDYILPGELGAEPAPSEIRHAASGQVLRQKRG